MPIKNYKHVSVLSIVERITRDTEYTDVSVPSMIEWVWEILELLNIPVTFLDLTCEVDIVNYRGSLPVTLRKLTSAREFYSQMPMIEGTDLFFRSPNSKTGVASSAHINETGGPTTPTTDQMSSVNDTAQYKYKIENGYIIPEFFDGKIEIAYQAYPLDEFGYPMIPEDIKVINAVKFYIIERLDYKLFRSGKIADKVYNDSKVESQWAISSAISESNMPSLEEMEIIRRFSSLLVSDTSQFDKGFANLGG